MHAIEAQGNPTWCQPASLESLPGQVVVPTPWLQQLRTNQQPLPVPAWVAVEHFCKEHRTDSFTALRRPCGDSTRNPAWEAVCWKAAASFLGLLGCVTRQVTLPPLFSIC